ncbi:hypothetical protein HanPI659440_Chr15g0596261 [Helianthus annuus]|nr:hypothetical protein HanPI659440_Chr15g0596261 [Helianthus annuus]
MLTLHLFTTKHTWIYSDFRNTPHVHIINHLPLTDEDIEGLIAELLTVESKVAEAQEALEDESLAKVEVEVREELAQTLEGLNGLNDGFCSDQ